VARPGCRLPLTRAHSLKEIKIKSGTNFLPGCLCDFTNPGSWSYSSGDFGGNAAGVFASLLLLVPAVPVDCLSARRRTIGSRVTMAGLVDEYKAQNTP